MRAETGGRRPQADVRRRVGVDGKRLSALPGLQGGARRGRRIQRQVHVQSVRAARRLLRHARRAHPRRPTAISSIPISAGSSWACGWPATPDGERHPARHRRRPRAALRAARPRGSIRRAPILPSAVLAGFARKPRSLPCRFFYDARGSALFEEITQLPEYYPTRAETALLEAYGDEIAERMGDARVLVEFGSGSSRKTSLLLSALAPRRGLCADRRRRREPGGGGGVAV